MTDSCYESDAGKTTRKPRLIVLDDNPGWGNFVSEVAEKTGYFACYTTSHAEFVGAARADPPDVLVLDLFMPERDGIEMIDDMAQWDDRPLIILVSGHSAALLTSAVRLGRSKGLEIVGSLVKPFRLTELRTLLGETASLVEKRQERGDHVRAQDAARTAQRVRRAAGTGSALGRRNDSRSRPVEALGDASGVPAAPLISENNSLKILRDQVSELRTGEIVRNSIAAINTRFCLALWETHRAALTALNDVPGRLIEAGRALVAVESGTGQADSWYQALRIDLRTLVSNQPLIRQIANSLQFTEHGRSTVESIDRLKAIISELEDLRRARRTSGGSMLALHADICDQCDRITDGLSALLAALNEAVRRGRSATEFNRSGNGAERNAGVGGRKIVEFWKREGRKTGSENI